MKHFFLTILFLTSLLSCKKNNEKKIIEGNIYITLINIFNTQSIIPKDKIDESKKAIINFDYKNKTKSEKELNDYYKTLIDNDLFYKSSFQLKLSNDKIINVYIDDLEYQKLNKELVNLNREKEKIEVKFEGIKISDGIYDKAIYSANKIISVEKSDGSTDWHK